MASQKGKPRMISGALRIDEGKKEAWLEIRHFSCEIKKYTADLEQKPRKKLDCKCRSGVRSPVSHFLCVDGEQPSVVRTGHYRILLMKPV